MVHNNCTFYLNVPHDSGSRICNQACLLSCDAVGADQYPAHQGSASLDARGVDTIHPCFCEYSRSSAVPGQPHQPPERVRLDTQSTILLLSVFLPQAVCIKICAESSNENQLVQMNGANLLKFSTL